MRDEGLHRLRGGAVVARAIVREHRVHVLIRIPVEPRGDVEIEVLDGEVVVAEGLLLARRMRVDFDLLAEADAFQLAQIAADLLRVVNRASSLLRACIRAEVPSDVVARRQLFEPIGPPLPALVPFGFSGACL